MSVKAFIHKATDRGIKLTLEGGQVRYTAPEGVVTPAVLAYLRDHKREIISRDDTPTAGGSVANARRQEVLACARRLPI